MIEPIQLREFQSLNNDECIREGIHENEIRKIDLFNRKQKKQIIEILRDGIKATSYVGVLSIGHKTIQILPKISKNPSEDYTVKNLLYMLSYTINIEVPETEISKLCERKHANFFEIIIYLFSRNLLELLKKNMRKDYRINAENLGFIKGSIVFQEHLNKNLVDRHRIYCCYSDFSENILLNQIFRYTSWLLTNITEDPENYRLLREINFLLSEVSHKRIKPSDFDNLHLDRLNSCYKPLVDLARIFVTNSTVEMSCDKLETFSFMFDMNALFEQFIAGFIIKNKNKIISEKCTVRYHDTSKYLVDQPKPSFRLIPDILVSSDEKNLIIDTKYKILDPEDRKMGVSQSDLYQAVAYGLKHNCKNIILLYPAHLIHLENGDPFVVRYEEKEINIFIRTFELNQNLQKEKQTLIDQLRIICKCA